MILTPSRYFTLTVIASLTLTSCSGSSLFKDKEDAPLPGKRISVLELDSELTPDTDNTSAITYSAPQVWENELWPQHGGYPTHAMQNLQLSSNQLKSAWQTNIGKGSTKQLPLTAQPIVTNRFIIAMDTNSTVKAFSLSDGKQVWETSILPKNEGEAALGGGLAFSESFIYSTNGFGEVTALHANDGKIKWKKSLSSPARAAPTVLKDALYVQLLDNTLLALSTKNGAELWRYTAFSENSSLIGAASPAANSNTIIAAFSSGEISHLNAANGMVKWSDSLAPRRKLGGVGSLSDVIALPVIDRDSVYGIGFGGQMARYDLNSGMLRWRREIGSIETPWVAGEMIFVTTLDNQLVGMDKNTGTINWITSLSQIDGASDGEIWTGPIMGNSKIIIASSKGKILQISPKDGKVLNSLKAPGPVSVTPIIAGKTLYVLSDNGKLAAYK